MTQVHRDGDVGHASVCVGCINSLNGIFKGRCLVCSADSNHFFNLANHEKTVCEICEDEPANTMLLPCHHAKWCNECLIRHKKCPDCNVVIQRKIRLYPDSFNIPV
jgi:hypothetical protein